MKKLMTIFGAFLFASIVLTSCDTKKNEKKDDTNNDPKVNTPKEDGKLFAAECMCVVRKIMERQQGGEDTSKEMEALEEIP